MVVQQPAAHRGPMVEVVLVAGTLLAFLVLVAAVPVELGEERRDEAARRSSARQR